MTTLPIPKRNKVEVIFRLTKCHPFASNPFSKFPRTIFFDCVNLDCYTHMHMCSHGFSIPITSLLFEGNPGNGSAYFPKILASFVNDVPWMTPRMRTRILCTILSLLATCSQNRLPYHADNGVLWGSNNVFFGDPAYLHELVSLSEHIVQNLVDAIQLESSPAARGILALEACNSILSSFTIKDETYAICSKLMETAKLCMSDSNKYLQSTFHRLEEKSKLLVRC